MRLVGCIFVLVLNVPIISFFYARLCSEVTSNLATPIGTKEVSYCDFFTTEITQPRHSLAAGSKAETVLGNLGAADRVGIGAEPNGLRGLVVDHMSDGSPSTFDIRDADDFLGFSVKSHKAIGI